MPPRSPIALFLTWRTYGTWLPRDARGWIDERSNAFGEATNSPDWRIEDAARSQMTSSAFTLNARLRELVDGLLRGACAYYGWPVYALNERSNHIHIVLSSDDTPKYVLTALKAHITKDLKNGDLVSPGASVWARGGSRRFLFDDSELEGAVDYVLNRQ
jgi:hypothetical protein